MAKSTIDEIRERFDNDVERFANLDTGQLTTIDAKISLELITGAAQCIVPTAKNLLDIGCGAGNYTLQMLTKIPNLNCTLLDLSQPMLDRAAQRVRPQTSGTVNTIQCDLREAAFPTEHFDIILAGAVLHHLREDADWETTFAKLYGLLKPGGCLLISDLITQDSALIDGFMTEQYGNYLEGLRDAAYRAEVLAYIEKEDSPRSLNYQLDLMKRVGFREVEILHKNMCFAAFGGIK